MQSGEVTTGSDEFQRLYSPPEVIEKVNALDEVREIVRMVGPDGVDERAEAVLRAVTLYWGAHNYVLNARVSGAEQDQENAWTNMADTTDDVADTRRTFIEAARSALTDTRG